MIRQVWQAEEAPEVSPYVDWWDKQGRKYHDLDDVLTLTPSGRCRMLFAESLIEAPGKLWPEGAFDRGGVEAVLSRRRHGHGAGPADDDGDVTDDLAKQFPKDKVPMLPGMSAPEGGYHDDPRHFHKHKSEVTAPPRDAVICGIVDEGIALAHERFMGSNGKTRVLAAWLQAAVWSQPFMPFGREYLQRDLDHRLAESHGDVDAFYRGLGLTRPSVPKGPRAVDRPAGHGSHVLDLFAGSDPEAADPRLPIIAVELPPRETIGLAGAFLPFFVLHGVQRVVDAADGLWEAHYGDSALPGETRGWPIVINLSYGQQAGAKDGSSAVDGALGKLIERRAAQGLSPLRIVMPSGNDNLMRCHARLTLAPQVPGVLDWRLQPEDMSANFVEIWSEVEAVGQGGAACPLTITVTPPGGTEIEAAPARPGHVSLIGNFARIYCRRLVSGDGLTCRYNFVVCAAPTLVHRAETPQIGAAPAGLWRIRVASAQARTVFAYVQVDQAPVPGGQTSRRSYFDEAQYRPYDAAGRLVDSYSYPEATDAEPYESFGPVQRKGTINSLGCDPSIVTVGGYRQSDGRPAAYSATALPVDSDEDAAFKSVNCAFPSEVSPAGYGLRAAGTRSGATVAMRGTSFAAARASRYVAEALLGWHGAGRASDSDIGSPAWIEAKAAGEESQGNADWGTTKVHPGKVGAGRIRP